MWLRGGRCMGGPHAARPAAAGEAATILLAGPASEAERALVTRWLRDGDLRPSTVLPLDGPGLARSLDRAVPETVVTAVRVAWLPRERGGERRGPPGPGVVPRNPPPPPRVLSEPLIQPGGGPRPAVGGR